MKSNISKPKNQPQKLNKNNNVSVANKTNFSTRRKNKSIKVDRYDGNSFVLKKQEFVQNIVPFSGPKFSATRRSSKSNLLFFLLRLLRLECKP
jgi:hypothetical protein